MTLPSATRIIDQPGAGILAHNVGHRGPVEIVLQTKLERIPGVVNRLRENHRVDNKVEFQFVLASIIPGQLDIPFNALGLSAFAEVDQIIAASFVW